jgi:diguanylate cyclase (GGDEF)-like protein/PAS domain S-box-containing protein
MHIQAEANLSALIESTEDLIWSVDLDDRLVTSNGALSRHILASFGFPPKEGMLSRELVPSERANLLPPLYKRAREEGPFRIEFPLPNGRILELALSPILVDGKVTGVSVFGKDVTAQKAAEQALREAERKYRDIFDNALEGMFQNSPKGEPLAVNPALVKMLGYESRAEYLSLVHNLGQDVWANPDERAVYLRQVEEHGSVLGFECNFKRKDGTLIRASVNARRVCGADGQLHHYEGFIIDITERTSAERAQREGLDTLRETELVGALGSYVLDIPTGRWTSSDALDEFFGIGKEYVRDVAGWAALVHPDDRDQMKSYFAEEVLGKTQTFDKEYRILRQSDGTEHWVHGMGRLEFDAQGKPVRMRGFIKDITEPRRAERQLRDSEERYRATFEQAPVGLVHTSFEGRILRCNTRFAEILGYSPEEIPGKSVQELTAPEDIAQSVEQLQRLSDSLAQTSTLEKRFIRKDGSLTWVKLTISVQRDDGGRPLHFITFAEDINARKAAEMHLAVAAEALRMSEERYRVAFQTSLDCVNINRLDNGVYVDVNRAFVELIGYERQEILGRSSLELEIWADPRDRLTLIEALRLHSVTRNLEAKFRRKNGTTLWGLMSASVIELEGVPCVLSITRDITEAKIAEQRLAATTDALQASEERYRTVFHTSLDCITLSHLSDGRFIDANHAFLDMIGMKSDEILGRTSKELGIWANPEARVEIVEMVRRNETVRDFQTEFVKKSGERFWVLISAAIIQVGGISCLVSVVRDISSVKAAESKIHNLALYDPLTGLPNRRSLFEKLGQTLTDGTRKGRLKALLLVDIDNLKTLNDTLGHHTGDLLLQKVAQRIAACSHDVDTVCRLGGDEFVVILDDLSDVAEEAATQAKATAEQILTSIRRPCLLENREYLTSASMGVTVFGDRDKSADQILQQADIALHLAKAEGRNTLRFFSPALQAVVNAHATLEKELRWAIKEKQFLLYYQPQVERGKMTGAEALIRWKHPSRGIVPPDEFIPMAEESRLILPLGDWVLETACEQLALWADRKETAHLTISVNISALQFRQPEFVEHVLTALERTHANPRRLKLELTESMLVDSFEDVIATMAELKAHGLSFSLDDFGTGYSSLAYLKRLPLDQLKIDRAFVRDMLVDLTSGAIAQTIISLGRAMDLSVVAEGVESEEQRGFLAGLGCHCFQGYLFSRPIPLEDFQRLLRDPGL